MGMTAIMVALAVAIAIVVAPAIFTALDVFLELSARKAALRERVCYAKLKRFEIMTGIEFAKAHMGEYFQWLGYKVRVIGYDTTGDRDSVIVDCTFGWDIEKADPTDAINTELCETGRCIYVTWEDLKL
mgnify:CR=1 FL=1